jgi:hypothetical protein
MTRDPKVLFGDGTELLHAYPFLYIGSLSFTLQFFFSPPFDSHYTINILYDFLQVDDSPGISLFL